VIVAVEVLLKGWLVWVIAGVNVVVVLKDMMTFDDVMRVLWLVLVDW
jgi:hypothetical protein